jgi:hypothetical protein
VIDILNEATPSMLPPANKTRGPTDVAAVLSRATLSDIVDHSRDVASKTYTVVSDGL